MKNTFKIAFCAVISALSVVFMFLTGIIPIGTYALPCIAGAVLCAVVIECGYPAAFSVYIVSSVLSFFIAGDKEAVLYYALFLGCYPVIKGLIEKIRYTILQWIFKYCVFNVSMVACFYLGTYILSIPKESYVVFGVYLPWAFLIAGNVIFAVYDLCLTRIITIYVNILRKKLKFK